MGCGTALSLHSNPCAKVPDVVDGNPGGLKSRRRWGTRQRMGAMNRRLERATRCSLRRNTDTHGILVITRPQRGMTK